MKKKKSTRQLVGIESITNSGVQTADGELSFYFVQPTNLNVLPEAGVRGRVTALLSVLKGMTAVEMLVLDSKESFQDNRLFYRQRIKKDAAYKESIQTAKESLLMCIRMLESSGAADTVIEQKLRDLSRALVQVDGKHAYAYLPKEVKAQVDEIVERLAQLPEVAVCYDQWWKLKDEIAGYYGRNIPPRQPLSQQEEFRAIKNFIIREAETIREPTPVQTSTDAEPSEPQKPLDETPTAVQQPQIAPLQNALTADAVMQLLLHMSRMFRGNMPVIPPALRIDSKRRRRLQEKRMAMGRKRDDHEEAQRQEQVTS